MMIWSDFLVNVLEWMSTALAIKLQAIKNPH